MRSLSPLFVLKLIFKFAGKLIEVVVSPMCFIDDAMRTSLLNVDIPITFKLLTL